MNPKFTSLEIDILRWLKENIGQTRGIHISEILQATNNEDNVALDDAIKVFVALTKEGLIESREKWNPDTQTDEWQRFEITREGLKTLRYIS